jgi:hypothetical protein
MISAPAGAASGPGPQIFTHVGKEQTYTVPSGITYIQVSAVGAPGAAGAAGGASDVRTCSMSAPSCPGGGGTVVRKGLRVQGR